MTRAGRLTLAVAVVGGSLLLVGFPYLRRVAAMAYDAATERFWNTGFDPVAWRDPARAHLRARMVDDLLARHSLVGMERTAVVALLGEPRASPVRGYHLAYPLGPERGWPGPRPGWLVLRLDDRGRVVERRVLTD